MICFFLKTVRSDTKMEDRWGSSRVFLWVYCCNMVILINIYLPGKVERMISSRVCRPTACFPE